MIKVEVINEDFTLKRFDELKNIVRKNREEKGKLFKGDVFECSEELCDYLSGNNPLKKAVVKIIEIKPKKEIKKEKEPVEEIDYNVPEDTELKVEMRLEEKPKKKKTNKK